MFPSVTVIVPTYKEVENLPLLIKELESLIQQYGLTLELLIMDDASQDGSEEAVEALHLPWVKMVVRNSNRGLSPAVVDGFALAQNEVIVVMDADLSHPISAIPVMLEAIQAGHEFVLGSRYIEGASTDETWGVFRKLNSWGASVMAWPLSSVNDPMSGFFAFRREILDRVEYLNPIGYKIGLEVLVKARIESAKEIPIYFTDRKFGSSKLSIWEQLKYIQHLRRLYIYKYPEWAHLSQFLVVGALGVIVNLITLTLLLWSGFSTTTSLIGGIAVSLLFNFLLDRRFTFSYARNEGISFQFIGFVLVCLLGAAVNFQVATALLRTYHGLAPQLAEIVGIFVGTLFNYTLSRYFVFRKNKSIS